MKAAGYVDDFEEKNDYECKKVLSHMGSSTNTEQVDDFQLFLQTHSSKTAVLPDLDEISDQIIESSLQSDSLIQCPKRVQPPRNSKRRQPKGSNGRESAKTKPESWDCFLKKIGNLSIEIDDDLETFI